MKGDNYDVIVEHITANQEKYYRTAYCYVYEKEAALDIVQNAVCRALENYRSLKNKEAVRTWFYRILVNESLQYIRKHRREIASAPEDMKEEAYYEPAYEPDTEVYKKVCSLPEKMKTIIILHFFEQMTLQEVADTTGVNLNTVKTRMYAALRRLRNEMEVEA